MNWYGFRYRIKIEFQDVLALTVVLPFLVFTVLVILQERDLEVIRTYIPLISIILGGYFGQGAIREWQKKNKGEKDYGDYSDKPPI